MNLADDAAAQLRAMSIRQVLVRLIPGAMLWMLLTAGLLAWLLSYEVPVVLVSTR